MNVKDRDLMADSYDLTQLDPSSFEHMITALALRVLGSGLSSFGPGSDGGRDGYFEGEAPYPSTVDRWKGRWYIQSKFHKPHLSKDPQTWLLDQIKAELQAFSAQNSKRTWPDIWIVATNVDPSGVPMTGAFDKARRMVAKARPKLKNRFHIWGGRKLLEFLNQRPDVATMYGDFLAPGHVFTSMYNQLKDANADIGNLLRFLLVRQFEEQKYTKLEQAGSDADTRPGIHKLFIDLPFRSAQYELEGLLTEHLVRASAKSHRVDITVPDSKEWRLWRRYPSRARVWFIKGGPGHGKSTIGQYFSQIQRAALILETDGPKVSPSMRTEAEAIREVAKVAGFWPTSPRIPISVELKDYAQWLGQRNPKEVAIGILSYLSDRLSRGIEQDVKIGLIKRAMRSKSWFVVFDGLDEVPHDVKDTVALEVLHFLNDIVIECDSDVLSICTSRPQGYSGQFADLDGPTVELTSLPPERALQCAKPVVELGRTPDEARRAFEILKSAITSPSVKELMTTPLQSHIMAVVVRDGGKPPDRRWQLFHNFYHVIKRRETNKNPTDKHLAKLLREDEKLLKTLHNQLGFLLHARAETSQGAQTHLGREEFRSLAHTTVSQMVETRIDQTVETLMSATVDRLVLVSTPDDGDHLRFDIRPLQEFFAAEFLYEGVQADKLASRLELVAGDAHWHEVMHFLLSALVENDRRTELAVAVAVLDRLNDGIGENETRLLRRRIARGALLAARLLQEGVLEQDKQNRQFFRKCLDPIVGFTDAEDMRAMLSVTQPNSAAWELMFLFQSLCEFDRFQNIGASIILAEMLPDGDPRVNEAKAFIDASPGFYVGAILAGLNLPEAHERFERRFTPSKWLLETVIAYLGSSKWRDLGEDGLKAVILLFQQDPTRTLISARSLGFSESQTELVNSLMQTDQDAKRGKEGELNYGLIWGSFFEHDWTTGTVAFGSWTNEISEKKSKVSGLFVLLYRIFRLVRTQRFKDFQLLFEALDDDVVWCLKALPSHVQAHLPLDQDIAAETQIALFRTFSEDDFKIFIAKGASGKRRVVRRPYFLHIGNDCKPEQWYSLVQDYPKIALDLWSDYFWHPSLEPRPPVLTDKASAALLATRLLQDPEILLERPSVWGKLLGAVAADPEALRSALQTIASKPVRQTGNWSHSFSCFRLRLPQEAELLPHLLNALSDYIEIRYGGNELKGIDRLKKNVGEMIGDVQELRELLDSRNTSTASKAAARFFLLMHPSSNQSLQDQADALISCYEKAVSPWFFKALVAYLINWTSEKDPWTQHVVGHLFLITREDLAARRAFEPLLRVWREASTAPIQSANVIEQWLNRESA